MTVEQAMDRCGTYAGWNRHQKAKTPPCEPCRLAQRIYMREYRSKNPDYVDRVVKNSAARSRALTRLAQLYPKQFGKLYREEMKR